MDGEVGGDGGDDGGVLSESPFVVFGSKAGPGSGLSEGGLKKHRPPRLSTSISSSQSLSNSRSENSSSLN